MNDSLVFSDPMPTRREHSFPAFYRLTHLSTSKVYFGSTGNLYIRINQHKIGLINGTHKNRRMLEVFTIDPHFKLSYIRTETVDDAREMEQDFFDAFGDTGLLLNIAIADVNANGLGVHRSDETKQRIRIATNRQFATEEARLKHSELSRRQWEDPEYRAKQSNREISLEARSKLSMASFDLWKDPDYRERVSQTRRRSIILDGVVYPSIKEAALILNLPYSTLSTRINKRKKVTCPNN